MRSLMDAQITSFFIGFPTFALIWITFFLAGIATFVAQIRLQTSELSFVQFFRHCFPFEHVTTRSVRMDAYMYLISKLTDKAVFAIRPICALLMSSLIAMISGLFVPWHSPIQPDFLIITGCSLSVFLVIDFANYVTHYLLHNVPTLWALHKVHHSSTFLTPITARRLHPLDDGFVEVCSGLSAGLLAGIFQVMFGFSSTETLFLLLIAERIAMIGGLDALRHSHFPIGFGRFDRVLISPHMHQAHHAEEHWNKNFGYKLSVWDWMFGTAVKPVKGPKFTFGIGEENSNYLRLADLYIGSLAEAWHLTKPTKVERNLMAARVDR